MSGVIDDVLHVVLDVLSGRINLPAHDADVLHEKLTPGHTAKPVSEDAIAAAMAVLEEAKAYQAKTAPAEDASVPA